MADSKGILATTGRDKTDAMSLLVNALPGSSISTIPSGRWPLIALRNDM
jgi:hypothetical protein